MVISEVVCSDKSAWLSGKQVHSLKGNNNKQQCTYHENIFPRQCAPLCNISSHLMNLLHDLARAIYEVFFQSVVEFMAPQDFTKCGKGQAMHQLSVKPASWQKRREYYKCRCHLGQLPFTAVCSKMFTYTLKAYSISLSVLLHAWDHVVWNEKPHTADIL